MALEYYGMFIRFLSFLDLSFFLSLFSRYILISASVGTNGPQPLTKLPLLDRCSSYPTAKVGRLIWSRQVDNSCSPKYQKFTTTEVFFLYGQDMWNHAYIHLYNQSRRCYGSSTKSVIKLTRLHGVRRAILGAGWSSTHSTMMLVKFMTSANQKHWIWSCQGYATHHPVSLETRSWLAPI